MIELKVANKCDLRVVGSLWMSPSMDYCLYDVLENDDEGVFIEIWCPIPNDRVHING